MKKSFIFVLIFGILSGCNSLTTPPEPVEIEEDIPLSQEMLALNWLKQNQNKDGSWGTKANRDSLTPLAILAFISLSETPASQEYGETVKQGIIWIVNRLDDKARKMKKPAKAITMWCLAETYGMTQIPMLEKPLTNWLKSDDLDYSSPYTVWAINSCYFAGIEGDENLYKNRYKKCLEAYKDKPETLLNESSSAFTLLRLKKKKDPLFDKIKSTSIDKWKMSENPILTAVSLWQIAWGVSREKEWNKEFWPEVWKSQNKEEDLGYWSKKDLGIRRKLSIPDLSEEEKRIYITSLLIISIPPVRRLPTFRIDKEHEFDREDEIELIID